MGPLPPWTLGLASLTPAPVSSAARVLSIVVHVSLGIGAVPSRITWGQMVRVKEKPINTPTERAKLPEAGCLPCFPARCSKDPHSFKSVSVRRLLLQHQGHVDISLRLMYRLRGLVDGPSGVKHCPLFSEKDNVLGPYFAPCPRFGPSALSSLPPTCSSEGASHKCAI